jgi:hypothetical protein
MVFRVVICVARSGADVVERKKCAEEKTLSRGNAASYNLVRSGMGVW